MIKPIFIPDFKGKSNPLAGGACHSVRAVVCLAKPGAHGVTRPLVIEAWGLDVFASSAFILLLTRLETG
jgi:hypothetical protein